MIKCEICNYNCNSYQHLSCHIRKHNISSEEYYCNYLLNDGKNICNLDGCINKTKFIGLKRGYYKFCSQKCCNKVTNSIPHSKNSIIEAEKKKQIWYKSNEGKEYLKRLSESRKGKNNPRHKRSKDDWQKSYAKQSNKMKQNIAEGKFTPCVTNSWANSRCKIEIDGFEKKYRSSWDAAFQIINPNCEYETLRIQYISPKDNKWHNYLVDFIDHDKKIVYEIKPSFFIMNDINKAKLDALNKWSLENNYCCEVISESWFKDNAKYIDYSKYDEKIKNGMSQFL